MTTTPLVFIDTETTGVHPEREVWEIAMIRRDERDEREISFFVDVDLSKADPFGLSVGRFYERHPLGKELATFDGDDFIEFDPFTKSRADAAGIVAHWTHGAHLVGAVPNFDAETLAPLLRAHGLIPSWHHHLVDVEALMAGYLAGQGAGRCTCGNQARGLAGHIAEADCGVFRRATPPWKSQELGVRVGVTEQPEDERHTALGDARWARDVYDAVMGTKAGV